MNSEITLTAPDLSAIDTADLRPSTRMKYKRAIEAMACAGVDPRNHEQLRAYAAALPPSSRQFLKSAIRLLANDLKQSILAHSDGGDRTIADLHKLEALTHVVQTSTQKGTKAHVWLTAAQVEQITAACLDTIQGRRDWIVLGLLLGAGLRREELASLTFDAIKQQPTKKGMRDVLEVTGKGDKVRLIPIKPRLADRLRAWHILTGGGYISRSIQRGVLGESLSTIGIYEIVQRYGAAIGLPELAPHDCRRTYAMLGYQAGIPITQISLLLGHASIRTTQRYLQIELDLETTVSDFIPLSGD